MNPDKGRPGCSLSSRFLKAGLRTILILMLSFLAGCSMLSVFQSKTANPNKSQAENDPALSTNPEVYQKAEKNPASRLWTWQDGDERWKFSGHELPQLGADAWTYEADAIRMRMIGAPQLNLYDQRPHSLVLKVFQLSDQKPFSDHRKTVFGLQQMLTNDKFDPAVVSVNRYIIQPGSDQVITLDRQKDARFVGIVAGFYNLDGKTSARLIRIPAFQDMSGKQGWLYTLSFGFFGGGALPTPRPAHLKMLLQLGTDHIEHLRVIVQ